MPSINTLLARLVVYNSIPEDTILRRIADVLDEADSTGVIADKTVSKLNREINQLLDLATQYGFDEDLWQTYIVWLIATTQTPFGLCAEGVGALEGSVNYFAKKDFEVFYALFYYDFSHYEKRLDYKCFSILRSYKALPKSGRMYQRNVSEKLKILRRQLADASSHEVWFEIITAFYKHYGVGSIGLGEAFRVSVCCSPPAAAQTTWTDIRVQDRDEIVGLEPITNIDEASFDDLVGLEAQKREIIANTESFVRGGKANNLLL
jgi:predicted AAA+ superfamily ATPase